MVQILQHGKRQTKNKKYALKRTFKVTKSGSFLQKETAMSITVMCETSSVTNAQSEPGFILSTTLLRSPCRILPLSPLKANFQFLVGSARVTSFRNTSEYEHKAKKVSSI